MNCALAKSRVLIVDDHSVFRQGMAQVIAHEQDLEVCAEAANAEAALQALRESRPDLALLDISLRGTNGIDLLKQIKAEHPGLPVLILSMHDETHYALPSLRAGANGYVMKSEALKQVVSAVRKVLSGGIYVSSDLGERPIFKAISALNGGGTSPVDALTATERDVFWRLGDSLPLPEIAAQLQMSLTEAEAARSSIQEKLGCRSASELVRFAVDWGSQRVS